MLGGRAAERRGAAPAPIAFDRQRSPRRVQRLALARSDGVAEIADLYGRALFDLVMMSPSVPAWPSWRPPLRSQLLARLAQTGVPLWTAGEDLFAMHFLHPIRSVACLLDFEAHPRLLLARAAAFAERMRARCVVVRSGVGGAVAGAVGRPGM